MTSSFFKVKILGFNMGKNIVVWWGTLAPRIW